MRIMRPVGYAAALITAVASLGACGSDSNTSSGDSTESGTGTASGTLTGEGSTAQKNAIAQVISDFQQQNPQATVNYNGTGSGAGVKQFTGGQVDFAGSDSALKTEAKAGAPAETAAAATRCGGNPAWNLPLVVGPIAVAYNMKDVPKLVLTPEVTAKIFSGSITTWNDPAIAAINKDATLPAKPIKVFYRSDESGTSDNFQKYLAGSAPTVWKAEPSKQWTGKTGEGKPKSDGVSGAVKSTEGGVTYVEWSYATKNELGVAEVDNGAGPVALSGESAGKAMEAAKITGTGNDMPVKLDYATKQAGVYPIVMVTYEITCSKGLSAEKAKLMKEFLSFYASESEQNKLQNLGYAPLPKSMRDKVTTAVDAIS